MLIRASTLHGIRLGRVTVAFRRWRRPTVRTGGTLLTAAGLLQIRRVVPVDVDDITAADARRAGAVSRDALVAELDARPGGEIYRIEFGRLEADPRVAIRETRLSDAEERARVLARLDRMDAAAPEPWTMQVLAAIAAHPGERAADLCRRVGQAPEVFKPNVRKLKALGLTDSLEVGYRLSPRGRDLLARATRRRKG